MRLINGATLGTRTQIDSSSGSDLERIIEEDRKRKQEEARIAAEQVASVNNNNSENIFQKAGGIVQTGIEDIKKILSDQNPFQQKKEQTTEQSVYDLHNRDMSKDTISQAPAKVWEPGGYDRSINKTVAPQIHLENSLGGGNAAANIFLKSLDAVFNTPSNAVTDFVNRASDLLGSLDQKNTPEERLANAGKTAIGAVNIAATPLTTLLNVADEMKMPENVKKLNPIFNGLDKLITDSSYSDDDKEKLKSLAALTTLSADPHDIAKIINTAFGWAGMGGSWLSNKGLNSLPISDNAKETLRPMVDEVGGLLGQVALGMSLHAGGKKDYELTRGKEVAPYSGGDIVDRALKNQAVEVINEFSDKKITISSSESDINSAFKSAANKTHPDKTGGVDFDFKRINAARDYLNGNLTTGDILQQFQKQSDVPTISGNPVSENGVVKTDMPEAGNVMPDKIMGVDVPRTVNIDTTKSLEQFKSLQNQAENETNPIKLDEISKQLSEVKNNLDNYSESIKQTIVDVPSDTDQPLLKIDVAQLNNGKFSASFDANTPSTSVNSSFNYENLVKTKEEAVNQSATIIKNWAENEIKSATPSDVPVLQKIIAEAQNAMTAKSPATVQPSVNVPQENNQTMQPAKGQTVQLQRKDGSIISVKYISMDKNGIMAEESTSGLPMLYSVEKFSLVSGGPIQKSQGFNKSFEEKTTLQGKIQQNEQELQKIYTENGEKVAKALYEVYVELDISEAGKKNFIWDENKTGGGPTVISEKSKFPRWVPEEYRSKELFDKVMGGLMDPANIKFPDKNKTRQREFYNLLLDEVDRRAGIDTSRIREEINNNYQKIYEKTTTDTQNISSQKTQNGNVGSAQRSETNRNQIAGKTSDENNEKLLDEKWIKSHLEIVNSNLNPNLRALVSFRVFERIKDEKGNHFAGQAGKHGVDMARNISKIVFKETVPHELEHFATTFLDESEKKTLIEYYHSLSREELIKIFKSEDNLKNYQNEYASFDDPELAMADETLRWDIDSERYFESRPIRKIIKKIKEFILRVIEIINDQLSKKNKRKLRLSTRLKRESAIDIYQEVFNPNIKIGEGRFGNIVSQGRIAELKNNDIKTPNISFSSQRSVFRNINQSEEKSSARFMENFGFNPKNLEDPKSDIAKKETDKIIKRSDIAKTLSEKLGVPIRRGKFRRKGAIGIFKPGQKVIRIKKGGLGTVFHEVGHFLDDKFGLSNSINPEERKNLMEEYGYSYEGMPEKQRKEALAEFLRFRMTGQTARATKLAPHFSVVFDERMKVMPEIKEVIDIATADYSRWMSQPATAKVLSHISFAEGEKGPVGQRISNSIHNLYALAKDDLHPLSQFASLGSRILGKIPAEQNPYILARNLRGWVGKAETFLTKGTFGKKYWETDDKGKILAKFKGKSYEEIMKPLERSGKMDDFRVYIVSQRAIELHARKITTGISDMDAREALKEIGEKNPEFEKIATERRKYKDELLQYAQENGLLSEKGLAKIQALNQFHVPFYRVMEETTTSFMGGKKIAGNFGNPVKKIKGSEREIIDPIESDIKDTYAIINAAERNNVGIAMANLASRDSELGRLFERVDRPMQGVSVNVQEVFKKLFANEPELIDMIPEEIEQEIVTIFRPTIDRGQNMLNVNVGDQHLVYQVDPDLFAAIQGLNSEDIGMIMRVLSMPARLLRAGATLTPDFSLRNPLRDQFSAFVYSKYGFIPGVDLARGIFEVFKKGDVYDLWKMSGGEHSMLVSMDREILQKTFKEIMRTKKATALHYVTRPIQLLRALSEIGEQGTRLGEMAKALKKGANPIEAGYSSREITLDFARIGAKTKAINAIIAFFNANLEGSDRMFRSFKEKPFRTLFKVLIGITLPSILLYFANRKDPRWKEIPQWQKDLFWIVITDKHIYRIPKPFELGVIFGSFPERILEYIDVKDGALFDQLEKSILNGATPGFFPTASIPIIENTTNYSLFLDRPIVSRGQEGLPGEAQYGAYTSETAKFLGKIFNYSPSKIDNVIQGYSGGLGKYTTSMIDWIYGKFEGKNKPVAPTATLEDLPVIKSFTIRDPQGSSSESVNKVYNAYSAITAQSAYINKLLKDGNKQEAEVTAKKYPEVVYAKFLNATIKQFSTINTERANIRNSKNMSSDEKRFKTKELDKLQTQIAKKALDVMNKK